MLVSSYHEPIIKKLPILLSGYVSQHGNGITITKSDPELTEKLRIFANGKAEIVYRFAKDTFTTRKQLLPKDTYRFHRLLKKYNTPGALNFPQIADIFKKFFKHIEKCGCINTYRSL